MGGGGFGSTTQTSNPFGAPSAAGGAFGQKSPTTTLSSPFGGSATFGGTASTGGFGSGLGGGIGQTAQPFGSSQPFGATTSTLGGFGSTTTPFGGGGGFGGGMMGGGMQSSEGTGNPPFAPLIVSFIVFHIVYILFHTLILNS